MAGVRDGRPITVLYSPDTASLDVSLKESSVRFARDPNDPSGGKPWIFPKDTPYKIGYNNTKSHS